MTIDQLIERTDSETQFVKQQMDDLKSKSEKYGLSNVQKDFFTHWQYEYLLLKELRQAQEKIKRNEEQEG